MHHTVRIATAAAATAAAAAALALAISGAAAQDSSAPVLKGKAAMGGWQQDKPGLRRHLTLGDQPPIGKEAKNFSEKAPMPEGAMPKVPPGFTVEMVASGLATPRVIRMAPNGDLFVAEKESNTVRVLRVPSRQRQAGEQRGLRQRPLAALRHRVLSAGPNPEWVYIANDDGVVRFRYKSGDLKASGEPETIVDGFPEPSLDPRHRVHAGRQDLLSRGRLGIERRARHVPAPARAGWRPGRTKSARRRLGHRGAPRRGAVLRSGRQERDDRRDRPAQLLRPAHPSCDQRAWCVVNERDGIGDNTPFEYATEVKEGGFYGWPWYYIGGHEDPRQKGSGPT